MTRPIRRQSDWRVDLTPRHLIPVPVDRTPPFLFVPTNEPELAGVLISPWPARPRGPLPEQRALAAALARHLVCAPASPSWVDPRSGNATPAAIGEGQIRRRLQDNASFNVRFRSS